MWKAKIKRAFKQALGPVLSRLDYVLDYRYDFLRYRAYSMRNGVPKSDQQLMFRLLQRAHSFEKALSLYDIQPLFGREKLKELVRLIRLYESRGLCPKGVEYQKALNAYLSYQQFHQQRTIDIYKEFDFLAGFEVKEGYPLGKSVVAVTALDILRNSQGNFEQLSKSRFSVRQFSTRFVDDKLIEDAVVLAQKSPSVCNRQSGHVFLIDQEDLKSKVLMIQRGNAGFGHEIKRLLVITASIESFDGPKERNQAYIDGGLFAMSMIYALHYKGLAVCPLNWSSGREKDLLLRRTVPIPNEHVIIMLLGIGHHKEEYMVATSPRRAISDVFKVVR